jgi:hypothetical protein
MRYLDLDAGEGLAVVDADNRADHLRDNDGVAEVSLRKGYTNDENRFQ